MVQKALQLNPAYAQAYNLRAQLNLSDGRISDARSDYLSALQYRPDYAIAEYNLALLYDVYYQDIAEAIRHYETYLSLIGQQDETTLEWVRHLRGTLGNG